MAEPTADPAEPESPTCYRHPGRETWVRCTRCERPICPDCMLDAAVGFQCPECVREGNRTLRERRTAFGGRVGADGTLTRVLLGINVVCFLVQLTAPQFTDRFDLVPLHVAGGDYHRLLTAAFLHANLLHIGFNMYALFLFGTAVEQALGRVRFLALYGLAALGGSTLSYLLHAPLVRVGGQVGLFAGLGASGAVFGLFGAYFVIARRMRADTSQIVALIGINLLLGFAVQGIDNLAHIGGLAIGAALTFALSKAPAGPQRSRVQALAGVVVLVVLVGLVGIRTSELRKLCPGVGTPAAVATCSESAVGAPAR